MLLGSLILSNGRGRSREEGGMGAGNNLLSHPAVQWVGLEEIGLSGTMK